MKKVITILISLLVLTSCARTTTTNVLKVGMECNYAPFNWMQSEASEDAVYVESTKSYCGGYDVLVANEIAKQLNQAVEIVPTSWDGLIPALQSKTIDLIIAGMTSTSDRREAVSFTKPYYYSDYVVLVSKDSTLVSAKSLEDLSGAKFVGQMSTNYDLIIDQIPGVVHEPALASVPLIVAAIKQQAYDGTVVEKPVANAIVATNPELAIVEFEAGKGFSQNEDITTEVSIAVHKENTELLAKIDEILEKLTVEQRDQMMDKAMQSQPSGE